MSAKILVVYYSTYGHVWTMARSIREGAESDGAEVRLRHVPEFAEAKKALETQDRYNQVQGRMADVPEVTHDDLRWADGIAWGSPTRYGNMAAQMKQFLDTTGGLWRNGELEDKAASVFTSTNSIHGGQESTLLSMQIPLQHFGMILVGSPYGQNPSLFTTDAVVGGTPYGPSTVAGSDGSLQPTEGDLAMCRALGVRLSKVASRLSDLRGGSAPLEEPVHTEGD